jgi:hypothetical protein
MIDVDKMAKCFLFPYGEMDVWKPHHTSHTTMRIHMDGVFSLNVSLRSC